MVSLSDWLQGGLTRGAISPRLGHDKHQHRAAPGGLLEAPPPRTSVMAGETKPSPVTVREMASVATLLRNDMPQSW